MSAREPTWVEGERERRQRLSQELAQLKQMSKTLRTRALRSFLKRTEDKRLDIEQPAAPVKPTIAA